MYYLGFDIGSSSIKAALVDAETNQVISVVQYPESEMDIDSPQSGWAEQNPENWWKNLILASNKLLNGIPGKVGQHVVGIGISYQMHGLVLVDEHQNVIRPAIIWCDSRAVDCGGRAFAELGEEECHTQLLNSPGNFTASKIKWVQENEPEVFSKIHKFMLPGDFIAMKLTGRITTTPTGLSEGVLWDFKNNSPAQFAYRTFGICEKIVPEVVNVFSRQGFLLKESADLLGVKHGIPVAYRAGDQPNNAMSLGVLEPGQIAATGGTSGVVYGVVDKLVYDTLGRVNSFAHVNHEKLDPRIGVLLCINGAGVQYKWVRQQMAMESITYQEMESQLSEIPVNSDGLRIIPFGNGAERILSNRELGSHVINLHFNRHNRAHFYRASLEGIAYSFIYGIEILKDLGLEVNVIKVGNDNLFQSEVFSSTIATLLNCEIQIINTTGAVGAARAVGYTLNHRSTLEEAMAGNKVIKTVKPININGEYEHGYKLWKEDLEKLLTH